METSGRRVRDVALAALLSGHLLTAAEAATQAAEAVELTVSCGRFAAETERCRAAAKQWAADTGNRVRVKVASACRSPVSVTRRYARL
jgi:hypothetical protein